MSRTHGRERCLLRLKYRLLARQAPDDVTRQRINRLVFELEQKQREIDE